MKISLSYLDALSLVQEGDVLLFRGSGITGALIQRAGEGQYSHVGIASWAQSKILECVEFREGNPLFRLIFGGNSGGGGRSVSLFNEVNKYPGRIDVYRPVEHFAIYSFDKKFKKVGYKRTKFDGYKVTQVMRSMTGLPYGWKRIYWMAKKKLAGLRLFYNMSDLVDDTVKDVIYPVCSTALAYSFSVNGYDLVNHRSDEYTEPSDFARSSRLSYLFTLVP